MVLTAHPRLRPLAVPLAAQLDAVRAAVDEGRLRQHVERLDAPRSRRHAPDGLARAETYVVRELEQAGWLVERRPFPLPGRTTPGVNLLARPPATARPPAVPASTVLLGAHLDTVFGSPGADDNASGVACLLELARLLPSHGLAAPVRLAVFDEEETGLHGSRALAAELTGTDRIEVDGTDAEAVGAERPAAVVVFECVGYYSREPRSQTLPPGASLVFPGQRRRAGRRGWRGDWTLVAYRRSSRPLARLIGECLTHLAGSGTAILARDPLDIPVVGPLLRRYVPATRHFARSDHQPFWAVGVPAVQLTDTADFRNPHYHRPSDTPETLDYRRMADIVAATAVATSPLARP
ncbi:M20/M25/M40 family metallo-hydrolase [Plantactinospora sp. B5E13]|uniref:M20/M25/M40 family metallo-hydrolase n=1 Tax=Plantactinospora sp. B5E13 TaxID=3153758 RepID=UPI00325E0347